jgi:hypothetical protein
MESKVLAGLGVVVAVVAVGVGVATRSEPIIELVSVELSSSLVVWDGGEKLYWAPGLLVDGGMAEVLFTEPPCKRRPASETECFLQDGGMAPKLLRMRALDLSGSGCEGVACSVLSGVDPDAPEIP